MIFRNVITGDEIITDNIIVAKNWEEVKTSPSEKKPVKKSPRKKVVDDDENAVRND